MLNKGPSGPYTGSNAGEGATVHTAQVGAMLAAGGLMPMYRQASCHVACVACAVLGAECPTPRHMVRCIQHARTECHCTTLTLQI
jgi:hypothetical protein